MVTTVFSTCKNDVLVCYGKLNPNHIKGYKYVILESEQYSEAEVNLIKQHNELVLCYISLGEVNEHSKSFSEFKHLVSDKNTTWNSYYLNITTDATRTVLKKIISKQLEKGFDGLFLDNIDNYGSYGQQSDQRSDLITFLDELRILYPAHFFMQNAGMELIDATYNKINAVAFESVASDYRFKTQTYQVREFRNYKAYLNKIKLLHKNYKLPIILIEYADDYSLFKKIESRIKPTKWSYFIGKIELQNVTKYSKK